MLIARRSVRALHFVVFASLFSHSSAYALGMKRFLVSSGSETTAKLAKVESTPSVTLSQVVSRPKPLLTPTILTNEDISQARTSSLDKWTSYGGIMYKLSGPKKDITDMVAFDMDGTLITTKSGKTFAVNEHDWKLWDPSVKTVLQRLHAENKYLAIISNQSGVKEKKITKEALQTKVDRVIEALGVPMDFICAIDDDRFRKPRTGMWEFLCQARIAMASGDTVGGASTETAAPSALKNSVYNVEEESNYSDDEYAQPRTTPTLNILTSLTSATTTSAPPLSAPIMFATSLYVGDAAGRVKEGTRNKDFSDSDYKLALNLGIEFATPEKYFLGSTSRLHCQLPDPAAADITTPVRMIDVASAAHQQDDSFFLAPETRTELGAAEIVLLAAPPACGKSTLARRFEQGGYTRVNQDTLGSIDKCLSRARESLSQKDKHSVCVDNTNMDSKVRARWVQLARELNVQIRAVALSTPKEVCGLLSSYRLLNPNTEAGDRRKIERIVINTYFKNPVYPSTSEGFSSVDTVPLDLVAPTEPQALRLFYMYIK